MPYHTCVISDRRGHTVSAESGGHTSCWIYLETRRLQLFVYLITKRWEKLALSIPWCIALCLRTLWLVRFWIFVLLNFFQERYHFNSLFWQKTAFQFAEVLSLSGETYIVCVKEFLAMCDWQVVGEQVEYNRCKDRAFRKAVTLGSPKWPQSIDAGTPGGTG